METITNPTVVATFISRLADLPSMEWVESIGNSEWQALCCPDNSDIARIAEAWAKLMQAQIAQGKTIAEVADTTLCEVEAVWNVGDGIEPSAVNFLVRACWQHSLELLRWFNNKYGIADNPYVNE